MNSFISDFERGFWIGLKIDATVLLCVGALCVAFTGMGFLLAGPMLSDGLDLIWGKA